MFTPHLVTLQTHTTGHLCLHTIVTSTQHRPSLCVSSSSIYLQTHQNRPSLSGSSKTDLRDVHDALGFVVGAGRGDVGRMADAHGLVVSGQGQD